MKDSLANQRQVAGAYLASSVPTVADMLAFVAETLVALVQAQSIAPLTPVDSAVASVTAVPAPAERT